MRKITEIVSRLGNTTGAEIAEAALVLPLVFLFLLGIIWFGRAYNIYSTMTQAAQQGAILAARSTCATCAPPTGGGWGSTKFSNDSAVRDAIFAVLEASSIDTTPIELTNPPLLSSLSSCGIAPLSPPLALPLTCSTMNNISICRNALLKPIASATQSPQCGVVVSFKYPFHFFYLPYTPHLSVQAQSRMEY